MNGLLDDQNAPQKPIVDPEGLRRLGATLHGRFLKYEMDRRLAELKWARNARQYLGIYDPDVELKLDPNRSRAYPKATRVKCVSMLSRLMNLLFQADDKCWTIAPSAVPDLDTEDLDSVLAQVQAAAQQGGKEVTDEQIEQAIRDFAKKRAARLELEIEDQLQELGGNRAASYVALCRKVLASGIQYGMGVLKGPFTESQQLRRWQADIDGKLKAVPYVAMRPRYEFVPLWDYYPDMSAKYLHQMEGQFQRVVMSKHQVIMLKQRQDFMADQVDAFLTASPTGNYKRRAFETELKAMGVQINVTEQERNKFEVIIWEGHVSGRELRDAGVEVTEAQLTEDLQAQVWFGGDKVLKADLNPWSLLETDGDMQMYHHFIFEEDESTLLGNGLPNIMRDSQMGICAASRMVLDNGAVQRNIEVNTALMRLDQDITSIQPDKIWYREDENPATANIPAIRVIDIPMHIPEMQAVVNMFQSFADAETFVNAATGGDMQKGPSEPFRTAAGASMLKGDAALPFKDVVRNFDVFTESVIGSLITFNKNFNPDPKLKGDFQPIARGATSLIAKEVLGIQLDNFATTLTPEEKQYVNTRELARARARVRDLVVEDIVFDDAKCDAIDAANAQQQQQSAAMATKMHEAQVRQILGDTLKAISQAGKNNASAEAATAKVLLDAMEKGLNPDELVKSENAGRQGGGAGAAQNGAGAEPGTGAAGAEQAPGNTPQQENAAAAAMPAGPVPGGAGRGQFA